MKLDWHPLSNKEIQLLIDRFFGDKKQLFAGCFARDGLPSTYKPLFYILNLDKATGPGTHWTMLNGAMNPSNKVYYFDPFGAPPFEKLKKFVPDEIGGNTVSMFYSEDVLQSMYSDMCGYYCIYMAYMELVKERTLMDVLLHDFTSDSKHNDRVVKQLFTSLVKSS